MYVFVFVCFCNSYFNLSLYIFTTAFLSANMAIELNVMVDASKLGWRTEWVSGELYLASH